MKVLHIISGLGDGGAEAVLYRLVTQNTENQHQVISMTSGGKYFELLISSGITVTSLDMPRGRVRLSGLWKLWKTVRRSRPDVIQTWMYHADLIGGIIGWLARIPVAWGIRNTTLEPGRSPRTTIWAARLCGRLSRRIPARIIVCAEAAIKVHADIGYDTGRMTVIPNGYDVSRFTPDATSRNSLRNTWKIQDDMPLLGMVARYDPYKDHANLIESFRLLSAQNLDFRAVLAGTGMDHDNHKVISLLEAANIDSKVQLLGPRPDIPDVMNALDVHVLSSSAEAFPNVLAEAMACGTPCATTDVGDAALIVGDTGWVVPSQNAQALADQLVLALQSWQNHSSWARRQTQCRERIVNTFSMARMINSYQQVWTQIRRVRK